MADDRPSSAPPASHDDAPLAVNLQIVSPSAGVGNLRFPDLPAATTLRQLKEKIRETLSWHPADDHQRLIHRGRLLARDTDTLQDVFGEESLRANEPQTIHLVVRPTGDIAPPSDSMPRTEGIRNEHNAAAMPRPGSAPIGTPHGAAHLPPALAQLQQQHQQQHQQQQELLQRIAQLQQREANYRHMLAQQQNLRAAMAPHPPSDGGSNAVQGGAADTTGGRNSPVGQTFRTVTREGTGPDGQRYSFRITMNEAIVPSGVTPPPPGMPPRPPSAFHPPDVRNMMHGAEATRAAQAMAHAMQRNASGAHPPNMAANMAAELAHFNFNTPIQPGVTTPIFPGVSRNASRAATPDIPSRSVSHGSGVMPSIFQNPPQPQPQAAHGQPVVYILNSPAGPQGLLVNGGSEVYTTPTARPAFFLPNFQRPLVHPTSPFLDTHLLQGQAYIPPGQGPLQVPGLSPRPYQPPPPSVQQQPLPQPNMQPQQPIIRRRPVAPPAAPAAEAQPAPQVNHPINPGVAPLVAAAWPHIWLIIRLIAFAWWFSYTNPSGERWLVLVLSMAFVFAINTGIFNGLVNNAFHPVREHLDGLLPLADMDRQQQQGQQNQEGGPAVAANQFGGDGAGEEPDPAQVAARLVAQRRIQNGSWLRDQMRRIERAGILFLASFAPGVAERHIRQQEERERAERAAVEAARAAAAAAAAAAAEAEAEAAAQQEGEAAGENQAGEDRQAQAAQERPQAPQAQPPQPPLVEV